MRTQLSSGLSSRFLLFMLFHERCGGWKDGRSCQEQSANHGAVVFGDDACQGRYSSSEGKADKILLPFGARESGDVYLDLHDISL